MGLAWRAATILFLFSLPLALLTTNLRLVVNNLAFYQWGFERHRSYQNTGLAKEELDRAAQGLIEYFNYQRPAASIRVSREGESLPLFNQREVLHLRDVRDLLQLTYRLQESSMAYVVLFTLSGLLWRGRKALARLARAWLQGAIFTVSLLLVMGLALLLDFDRLFLQFHLVSFSNDFWMLNPASSYLIRMVPQGFFFDLVMLVAGLTLLEGVILAALAGTLLVRQRRAI
jgi:integral membrane protein (TIGR01906 family)